MVLKTKKKNNHLPKIYCISLPKRLKYIKYTLINYFEFPKSKITFINPILKENINRDTLINKNILNPSNKLSNGEIACYMSHLKVLKTFLLSNHQQALIFEDDIERSKKESVKKEVKKILNNLPEDFDIVYLGNYLEWCTLNKEKNDDLNRTYFSAGLHSYLVSRKGAEIILNNCLHISKPIDSAISYLSLKKKIKCYSVKENIFNQRRDHSGILKSTVTDYYRIPREPDCVYIPYLYHNFKKKISKISKKISL